VGGNLEELNPAECGLLNGNWQVIAQKPCNSVLLQGFLKRENGQL